MRVWQQGAPGCALFLALASCAAPWANGPVPKVAADDYPTADAVILSQEGHLRFLSSSDPGAGYELTVRARVQVLTPGGRSVARLVVPLDHWTRIVRAGVRSYDAAAAAVGNLKDVCRSATSMLQVPYTDATVLYSDSYLGVIDLPCAEVGRILEYHYTLRSQKTFGLPRWAFDGALPVVDSTFTVEKPLDLQLSWGYSEGGVTREIEPERTSSGSTELLVFRRHNLAAVEEEPLGPSLDQLTSRLELAVGGGWEDVATFYRGLTRGLDALPEAATAQLAAFPKRDAKEPDAERIFRFVRDRIRYVAVAQGLGAFKPHAAAEVFSNRWGDCKDMATLLVALYQAQGIDAAPALISTRGYGVFHSEVASIAAFNHVVVALLQPDGVRFIDPTAKHTPFGELPWGIQGRTALLIRKHGSELVTLPKAGADANRDEVVWTVAGGNLMFEATLAGESASRWRPLAKGTSQQQLRRALLDTYLADVEGGDIEGASIREQGNTVVITAKRSFTLPKTDGKRRVLPLEPFLGSAAEIRVPSDRRWSVLLGEPQSRTERIIYKLPAGARLVHKPQDTTIKTDFAHYELSVRVGASEVAVNRKLRILADEVAPDKLQEVRRFSEAAARDGREAIIIED